MKRSEVKAKLLAVQAKLKKITESREDDILVFVTKDKYLDGVGHIHEIEDMKHLIEAQHAVMSLSKTDLTEAAQALGLSEDEIPASDTKIMGFKPKHWLKDIKTQLGKIREDAEFTKLEQWEEKLTKNLSADDEFALDMDGIDIDIEADHSEE
jgi:hypothetical protein